MQRFIYILLVGLLAMGSTQAREIAGVQMADEIRLADGKVPLVLNGAGIRKKFFFSIYAAGLYQPQTSADAAQILSQDQPFRVVMHVLYSEVEREKFVSGWNAGFTANLTSEEMAAVKQRLEQFNACFEDLKKGDEVVLDYLPDQGTRVVIKGNEKGLIHGTDFRRALLSVWLGKEPASSELKEGLLGKD